MVVARGIGEHVTLAFVEVIEGQRVLVRLEASLWREIRVVASDFGDPKFVDEMTELLLRYVRK